MSGGKHRSFITKVNGVICAQPIHNGQTFTKIILDTNTREMSYELIDVSSLKDDINESLEKIFTDIQIDLKDFLDKEIGHLDKDIIIDDMDKYYTIVLSNYRASNTSVYPAYENAEVLREISIDMSEIIMDYLQKKQQIKLIDESNYVVKY